MTRRFYNFVVLLMGTTLLGLLAPLSCMAQGRPDLVWMRGGQHLPATTLAYSPNGAFFASGDLDSAIKLWRLADGMLLRTLPIVGSAISVAVTPDSKAIIAADASNTITIWSIPDGKTQRTIQGFASNLSSMALSPDGTLVALGFDDGSIHLRHLSDGAEIRSWAAHGAKVYSLAFSQDGLTLASGCGLGSDLTARLWRVWDGAMLQTYPILVANGGYQVALPSGGATIAIGVIGTSALQVHNLLDGGLIWSANTNAGITAFALGTDGKTAACAIQGCSQNFNLGCAATVLQYQISDGTNLPTISTGYINNALVFSPDGQSFATCDNSGLGHGIAFWRLSTGTLINDLTPPGGGDGPIAALAISPTGKILADSASDHGRLMLRLISDGSLISYVPIGDVRPIAFSPDGMFIGGCYQVEGNQHGKHLNLWSVVNGSVALDIPGIEANVSGFCFTPDGKGVLVSSNDGLEEFNVSDGSLVRNYGGGSLFAISPDGMLLAVYLGANDGSINLLRTADGSLVSTAPPSKTFPEARSLAFSPDSTILAVGGSGDQAHSRLAAGTDLISVRDGHVIRTLANDTGVNVVSFSPDGQVLAAGDVGGNIRLWGVADGSLLVVYNQETDAPGGSQRGVVSLGYSPDDKLFYYGRGDGTICCALNPYLNNVFPNHGGNTGNVTAKVVTALDFPLAAGSTVTLTAPGQPDIVGVPIQLEGRFVLDTMFDLNGKPLGKRDVVITNADGSTRTYAQAFTIEQGVIPRLVTSIVGRNQFRGGTSQTFLVYVRNQGDIDGDPFTLLVAFPNSIGWKMGPGYIVKSSTQVSNQTILFIGSPGVPASGNAIIPVILTAPQLEEGEGSGLRRLDFKITAAISQH